MSCDITQFVSLQNCTLRVISLFELVFRRPRPTETKPLNFGLRRPVLSLANHRSPSTGDVIGNNSLLTSPFFFVIYLVIYLVWPHQSC